MDPNDAETNSSYDVPCHLQDIELPDRNLKVLIATSKDSEEKLV